MHLTPIYPGPNFFEGLSEWGTKMKVLACDYSSLSVVTETEA